MSTFADQMVAKLEALMLANPGAQMVNVDGNQVSFRDLEKSYSYWKSRAARASGARPIAAQINLAGSSQGTFENQ